MCFSIIFYIFLMKSRCQITRKTCKRLPLRKSSKNRVWNVFLAYKIDLLWIFGFPLGPRGPPRTWRKRPRIHNFFHESEEASENQPVALPGRLNGDARETPAVTQGSPGHQVTSLGFAEFFSAHFDCEFFLWASLSLLLTSRRHRPQGLYNKNLSPLHSHNCLFMFTPKPNLTWPDLTWPNLT